MTEVWSLIELDNNRLRDTGRKMASEACRTAKIFNADACGVIFSRFPMNILEELNWYGLKKLYLSHSDESLSPEVMAHSLYSIVTKFNPQFILFAATPPGTEVAGRVAVSLQRGLISDCIDFELFNGKAQARKTVYNGKAHAIYTWVSPPPYLATIDQSALEAVKKKNAMTPEIVEIKNVQYEALTRLIKNWEVSLSELDLSEARIVIGVGKGVESKFMPVINKLAESIRGVVGAAGLQCTMV